MRNKVVDCGHSSLAVQVEVLQLNWSCFGVNLKKTNKKNWVLFYSKVYGILKTKRVSVIVIIINTRNSYDRFLSPYLIPLADIFTFHKV